MDKSSLGNKWIADPRMKKFLGQSSVRAFLIKEDFEALYKLALDQDFVFIGQLHWIFEGAGVNPLEHLGSHLPARYFYYDWHLKSLVVPGKFKSIGDSCFAQASSLEEIKLEEGVEVCGSAIFRHCTELRRVILPESLRAPLYPYTGAMVPNLRQVEYHGNVVTAKNLVFAHPDAILSPNPIKITCKDGQFRLINGKIVDD